MIQVSRILEVFIVTVTLITVANSATLTEGPVSVSVLVGENALFHCNGSGFTIVWIVDGSLATDSIIVDRGITLDTPMTSSGTVQSTLTVPATLVNNGTNVQCRVVSLSGFAISNNATLIVLPISGIGQVRNVRFNPSLSDVLWDPPLTALSGLMYEVTTMNMNTGQIVVNETTNNTFCPLPPLRFCQNYIVNVTAFSFQQQIEGDSVVTDVRPQGNYYQFKTMSQDIVFRELLAVEFSVVLHLEVSGVPCPDQRLTAQSYPQSNTSDITNHPELVIMSSEDIITVIVYSITTGIERKQHYTATISLVGNEGIIQELNLTFSTFDIQDCDVSSDQHTSSILVECTFAINSTAPGIVVIQDDQSQYTINKTLQRLLQDSDKGSVNITGLPAGEYSVRVYDNSPATDSTSAAYQHSQLIHIMELPSLYPSSIISSNILPSESSVTYLLPSNSFLLSHTNISPSVMLESTTAPIVAIVGSVVVIIITIIIFLVVVMTVVIFIIMRAQRKTRLISVQTIPWAQEEDDRYQELKFKKDDQPTKHQGPVYADLHHSTNPPAPPIPVKPVQYATVKKQPDNTETTQSEDKGLHYAQVRHSTNPPAPPIPGEPVKYATVKKSEPVQSETSTLDCDLVGKDTPSSMASSSSSRETSETTVSDEASDSLPSPDCSVSTQPIARASSGSVNQPSCFVSANGLIDVRDPCVVSDDNGELLQHFPHHTEYVQR